MKKRMKKSRKMLGKVLGTVLALSLAFGTNAYAATDDIVSDSEIEDLMDPNTINDISDKVDDIGEQISNLSDAASESDSSEDENSGNSDDTVEDQIANLNNDYAALQQIFGSFTQNYEIVLNSILNYKSNVIDALNSNVFANNNIPSDTSYADTISIIKGISAPTTATGNYYTSGNNSGLGVGLSASSPSASVDIDGVNSLDLGINEAITLPSGYYPNDITIQNDVVNRGTLNWAPASNTTYTIPSGYYEGGTLSTGSVYKSAYDSGYTDGKSAGYTQGKTDGYAQGKTDGYTQGKNSVKLPEIIVLNPKQYDTVKTASFNKKGKIMFIASVGSREQVYEKAGVTLSVQLRGASVLTVDAYFRHNELGYGYAKTEWLNYNANDSIRVSGTSQDVRWASDVYAILIPEN